MQRNMTITVQQITDTSVRYTRVGYGTQQFRYIIPRNKPEVNKLIRELEPGSTYKLDTVKLPSSTWVWTSATIVDAEEDSPVKMKLKELVQTVDELFLLLE